MLFYANFVLQFGMVFYAWINFATLSSTPLLFMGISSLLSLGFIVHGSWALKSLDAAKTKEYKLMQKGKKPKNRNKDDPTVFTKEDHLYVTFFACMILCFFYVIVGTMATFFQERVVGMIDSTYSDERIWVFKFGYQTESSVRRKWVLILAIAGFVAYIMSILFVISGSFAY